jgi:hypothetical protein
MKTALLVLAAAVHAGAGEPPALAAYVAALADGCDRIGKALDGQSAPSLSSLERTPGLRHFPHAILVPAVLYTLSHPANPHRGRPAYLALALRIGDLLAAEDEQGAYMYRPDSYWDTTLWLDSYRLLRPHLDPERAGRWRRALQRNVELVAPRVAAWRDFPRYTAPFLGTSTNHYAQWAANVFLAGRLFDNPGWTSSGGAVLHRLAAEQHPDGFWGELKPDAPTIGYNLLTLSAVGMYFEHSRDPAALQAIQRATRFHLAFSWPSGAPVELLNDRNRYWDAWLYGNFAFSHSRQGRRFASFLFERYAPRPLDTEQLGRVAQNALYFRDGPTAPIPQELPRSHFRLEGPAGIRNAMPWSVALSGLPSLPPGTEQWFLERQANVAVYHRTKGLVLSGANSRHQPGLATFQERLGATLAYTPLDARLELSGEGDRLWLAYQRYFAEILALPPTDREVRLRFTITGRGPAPGEARLTLQLILIPGHSIATAAGRSATVSDAPILWDAGQLGGAVMHNGWTLRLPPGASLEWPVRPYNPYRNGPDPDLKRAVAALSVPLALSPRPESYVRPAETVLDFSIHVDSPQ